MSSLRWLTWWVAAGFRMRNLTQFEQFTVMLEGIDNRLPFTLKSGLSESTIAADIHRFSGGLIGRVMNLIGAAGFEAIWHEQDHGRAPALGCWHAGRCR